MSTFHTGVKVKNILKFTYAGGYFYTCPADTWAEVSTCSFYYLETAHRIVYTDGNYQVIQLLAPWAANDPTHVYRLGPGDRLYGNAGFSCLVVEYGK